MQENIDYELIPAEGDYWNVRVLTGPYTETVYNFGVLRFDESNGTLRFNIDLITSPDPDLSVDDEEFQEYCGNVLSNILENSLNELSKNEL